MAIFTEVSWEWWQSLSDEWRELLSYSMDVDEAEPEQLLDQKFMKKPLEELKNLKMLNLSYARVKDYSPLTVLLNSLHQLEDLDLSNSSITDISPLLGTTSRLKHVYLLGTEVDKEDIEKLKNGFAWFVKVID
ncbi:MAG: hypothetical protein Q4D05_04915 [Acinetobacter sp.]|nr:hypothetical protein [Acinetobacter sp.]